MLKFLRIICIWICCVSCLFGRITLPTVAAVPFEYFEDHEQYTYDMDTEQSKAKYDTRLLSEQLLKNQKSTELYDDRALNGDGDVYAMAERPKGQQPPVEEEDEGFPESDDMEPHERAASCFKSGRKYTHGQKVPRLDPCEVCLCMDGEIFCWWEKCAKKLQKPKIASEQMLTLKKAPQQQQKQKPKHRGKHESMSAEKLTIVEGALPWQSQEGQNDEAKLFHAAKASPKQQDAKHEGQLSEHRQEQQQKHDGKELEKRVGHEEHGHSSAHKTNKILNFPENLPSLLYYDYKTEEHHYHQHQHHQQHLKHQQEKLKRERARQQQQAENYSKQVGKSMPHIGGGDGKPLALSTPYAVVSTYGSSGNENIIYDETEIDSDILPEPPTKKPKSYATQTTGLTATPIATTSTTFPINLTTMTTSKTTMTTKEPSPMEPVGRTTHGTVDPQAAALVKGPQNGLHTEMNAGERNNSEEDQDAAFHRWLTSTESKINSNNNYDDDLDDMATTTNNGPIKSGRIFFQTSTSINSTPNATLPPRTGLPANNATASPNANQPLAYNDYSSEFNGSVVNIDIMLTAANDYRRPEQQQQQPPPPDGVEQIQDEESIIVEADLISPPNGKTSATTGMPTKMATTTETLVQSLGTTTATMAMRQQQLLPNETFTAAQPYKLSGESTNGMAKVNATTTTTTTPSPDRQCNVMGTLYKIGDILPQDTGNCLQCVCIDGSTSDDTPRVTCSPHNCPPLVLPDLFDATGY